MWKNGIGIVYKVKGHRKRWKFIKPPLNLRLKSDSLQVKFSHFLGSGKTYLFALSFPWTYTEDQHYFKRVEARMKKRDDIYFKREVIVLELIKLRGCEVSVRTRGI